MCKGTTRQGSNSIRDTTYWTLVGDRNIKKLASVWYLQHPLSHKKDQSQLGAQFSFLFKVGEEA